MKLLPWSLYSQLQTPAAMVGLKTVMMVSLLFSTAGLLTLVSTKTSLLLVVFYQGLLRSFGHFNHDEMLAVYCLAVLAFTPCGDAFSLDSWIYKRFLSRKGTKAQSAAAFSKGLSLRLGAFASEMLVPKKRAPLFAYAYPIMLMQLLVAWTYFSSALIKLRVAGFKYLSPDNLPVLAIFHSLDNLHDTHFRLAFLLPQVKSYLPFAVAFVLLWELAFPLAVFRKRLRWWILGIGVLFHVATLLLMNIFFPHHLPMYLLFVDWDRFTDHRLSTPSKD